MCKIDQTQESSGCENFLKEWSLQDWVAFMSQPYWVDVKVEVDIEAEVDMRLSQSLVEIELRLSWVGVEISWHWIEEEIEHS